MNILVTGGLGFIGSHTVVELMNNDHSVIIVDNLINPKKEVVERIYQITGTYPDFYQVDVTNNNRLDQIFSDNKIDGVIHLAGLKAIGESVAKPLDYYYNNIVSSVLLSKMCIKY